MIKDKTKIEVRVGSYRVVCKNDPVIIQAVREDLRRMHEENTLRAKHCRKRNGRLV